MITDKDVQKLLVAFTKIFATKDDLRRFVTKSDLKNFVTKDDLKTLATKKDLEVEMSQLATKEDLRTLKEEVSEMLTAFRSNILSHLDKVYKEVLAFRQEETIHTYAHTRQDEKLEDHEKRIGKIETSSTTP